MKTVIQQIFECGVLPVVKLNNAADAEPLAQALLRGGINCVEITFRTDAAASAIRRVADSVPSILVGAGTVLTLEQAQLAIEAGAEFLVSPGFNESVVNYALERGVPMFPGCNNPSDIERALAIGLSDLKFFPAEQSGGLAMIKALSGPYPGVRFLPTGGINTDNYLNYLASDKIIAVGGTWMVKDALISTGDFDGISAACAQTVRNMHGFSLKHVGVNCDDDREAAKGAARLLELFGLETHDGNSSVFAGSDVELMKKNGRGARGHIGIAANSVDRAIAFLAARGVEFINESIVRDSNGHIKIAYLKEELCGFALHLATK